MGDESLVRNDVWWLMLDGSLAVGGGSIYAMHLWIVNDFFRTDRYQLEFLQIVFVVTKAAPLSNTDI